MMRYRSRRCKCRVSVEGLTLMSRSETLAVCVPCPVSRVCEGVRLLPWRCSMCRRSCTRYRVWLGTRASSHPFSSPCRCACEAPRATILRPVNLSAYRFLVPAQPVPHACAHARILPSCRSLLGREHAAWFEQARAECGGFSHTHSCGAIASSRKTGPRKAARPPLAVRSRHRLSVSHRLLAQLRLRLWHRAPTLWHRALTLPNALRLGLSLGQGMEA